MKVYRQDQVFCDICKKEMTDEHYHYKGTNLKIARAVDWSSPQKFVEYEDICWSCHEKILGYIEFLKDGRDLKSKKEPTVKYPEFHNDLRKVGEEIGKRIRDGNYDIFGGERLEGERECYERIRALFSNKEYESRGYSNNESFVMFEESEKEGPKNADTN